jgi:hypothetical protein
MHVDESAVSKALADLIRRNLVHEVHRSDSRAKRYRQVMAETMSLHPAEIALLCVLMLRGPQTTGEIRTRSGRLFEFRDLKHVEVTLDALMTLPAPLVAQLPRQPGQKEVRYAHLLSGEPQVTVSPEPAPIAVDSDPDRVAALEHAVDSLRTELAELRAAFDRFREQFQ